LGRSRSQWRFCASASPGSIVRPVHSCQYFTRAFAYRSVGTAVLLAGSLLSSPARLLYNARVLLFLLLLALGQSDSAPWWSVQTSGLDTNLRGVSVKYDEGSEGKQNFFVWASGSNGVILRSVNGGKTWKQLNVSGGGGLDFRGIEAFGADVAYVMSSGDGGKSRIYKTTDGGKTWKLQYSDKRPGFFLDSLACRSNTHCFALSDPVDGKFLVVSTDDGEHWRELPRDMMPPALPKEGAFAASGTAIALCEDGGIYFGTGGPKARIFRSLDEGRSWMVVETPISSGNDSSGVFSIASEGPETLVAVGGDYREPARANAVAIYSADAGETWQLSAQQPGGYRSAVASFSYGDFAAVGPNGTDISHDNGITWKHTDRLNLNAVSFEGTQGWAVGPKGTIARFQTHFFYDIRNLKLPSANSGS
jgi:photosystem II stability/assembly factor-like uncharacterized protein